MSPSSTPHLSSTASYPTPSTVVTSSGLVQTTQPIRLPPLIPKAITDKLVYQQSQMEEMQRQMQRQDDTIESLRNTVDDLSNSRDDFLFEMKDLDAENIHLLQRVDVLENLVRKQTKKIDQLFEMLEDSEPHERTKFYVAEELRLLDGAPVDTFY
jgi:peptidoglycan hydrolase CwlO-like protein